MQTKMLARRLGALAVLGAWLAASPRLEADPPQGHETTFRLSGASAPPGVEAKVTFSIASNRSTQAFLFSIDFDEELLEAGSEMERIFQSPNGEPWGFALYYADNSNAVPGNAGVDEGYVVGAAVFSLNEHIHLPVGTETEVAAISLRVKPGAPIGSTQLRFVDGARVPDWDNPAENLVTLDQNGELPTGTQVSPLLIESNFRILPDISIFIRGDSNDDGKVDLADAQATLGYLFQAAEPLHCLDAADANDDGKLNVSDPVTILQVLFLGREALPAPSAARGSDPTPDAIGCGE